MSTPRDHRGVLEREPGVAVEEVREVLRLLLATEIVPPLEPRHAKYLRSVSKDGKMTRGRGWVRNEATNPAKETSEKDNHARLDGTPLSSSRVHRRSVLDVL